uniref:Uncharacterized protein n=1 Tax=Arundo donax TaxID=35708 RepID=A0A0A9ABA9_ARUDO
MVMCLSKKFVSCSKLCSKMYHKVQVRNTIV